MHDTTTQLAQRPQQVAHIAALSQSFRRSLLSENKAPRTVEVYGDAGRLLAEFLERVGTARCRSHVAPSSSACGSSPVPW
jgi:hypothetical protein